MTFDSDTIHTVNCSFKRTYFQLGRHKQFPKKFHMHIKQVLATRTWNNSKQNKDNNICQCVQGNRLFPVCPKTALRGRKSRKKKKKKRLLPSFCVIRNLKYGLFLIEIFLITNLLNIDVSFKQKDFMSCYGSFFLLLNLFCSIH